MKIAIGADHAGYDFKSKVIQFLESLGHTVVDCGSNTEDSSDYPDYAHKVADLVSENKIDQGVLICGSGIGMSMAANRHPNVRSFVCNNTDIAKLARQHNNANIICFGTRITDFDTIKSCLKTFFETEFEGGRHQRRVNKIERGQ